MTILALHDGPARAWTISLVAHGTLVLLLAAALGPGHLHEHASEPARLVWVEPAPPPALGPGIVPTAPVAEPAAAPAEVEPPLAHEAPRPPARLAPLRRHQPMPPPAAAPHAAADDDTVPPAAPAAGGTAEGTVGGATTGVTGGTVGGLGDRVLALRDVAAPPELLERVIPDYPPRARAMQIEGQVLLEVVLDRQGRIEDGVRVVRSIAPLDAAAIAAVKRWRFRPARDHDGRPVRVLMEIPVRFVLR